MSAGNWLRRADGSGEESRMGIWHLFMEKLYVQSRLKISMDPKAELKAHI